MLMLSQYDFCYKYMPLKFPANRRESPSRRNRPDGFDTLFSLQTKKGQLMLVYVEACSVESREGMPLACETAVAVA